MFVRFIIKVEVDRSVAGIAKDPRLISRERAYLLDTQLENSPSFLVRLSRALIIYGIEEGSFSPGGGPVPPVLR